MCLKLVLLVEYVIQIHGIDPSSSRSIPCIGLIAMQCNGQLAASKDSKAMSIQMATLIPNALT